MFSYRHYRKQYKIWVVNKIPTEGLWVKVSEASRRLGVSKQTIRIWALKWLAGKGGIPCVRVQKPGMKRGILYVKID